MHTTPQYLSVFNNPRDMAAFNACNATTAYLYRQNVWLTRQPCAQSASRDEAAGREERHGLKADHRRA